MILVTGGTGLVGAHLLVKLTQNNQSVRATYRDKSSIKKTKSLFEEYNKTVFFHNIEWIEADINDIPALEIAFKTIDIVYHCAAYISYNHKDENKIRKINIEGTANIVNLSLQHQIKRLCHVSSIAALGHPKKNSEIITEKTEWNPELAIDNYSISKFGSELEVLRGQHEGISTIIVNPGIIIGPGFWNQGSGVLFSKIKNGLRFYTSGSTAYTDIHDLISIMIKLTAETALSGKRFIIINENSSYKTIFNSIANNLKLNRKLFLINKIPLKTYYYFCSILSFIGIEKFTFSKSMFLSAQSTNKYSNKALLKQIKHDYKPIEQSIQETASFYK